MELLLSILGLGWLVEIIGRMFKRPDPEPFVLPPMVKREPPAVQWHNEAYHPDAIKKAFDDVTKR